MPRRLFVCALITVLFIHAPAAQQAARRGGAASITEPDLKEWLTYLSSDELQGRATHTEGLGLAAGYIAAHLAQWGVKPAGDRGGYLQTVKVLGVKAASKSSVTVDVNGQRRTFKDGEGITFPRPMGGKQTVEASQIVFAGYGMQIPEASLDDYAEGSPKGKLVVYLGGQGPAAMPQEAFRLLRARGRKAVEMGAIAAIGPVGGFGRGRGGDGAGRGAAAGDGRQAATDFDTVQKYDAPVAPQLTAQDDFFEFLFSGSDVKYAELKEKAAKREPLPRFALKGAKVTVDVDVAYEVVRTRLTNNVVGIVEGSDPVLKETYVAYGAHYDHNGFNDLARPGEDMIYNGADDDGSGTVAIMAIARAYALGPKPKRSILFVWHAGEETGLLGSKYMADYPVVGNIDKIVTQLNIDMIGRNQADDPANANMVNVVGADRISTELHNINEEANSSLSKPLTLDYALNDPADPLSIYTRSDHYSYAAKGIPIVFYFTGMHPDYHRPTDTVDKIIFDKVRRVAQLAFETGNRIANSQKAPVRDNKGPRAGKGFSGKITK